MNQKPKKLGDLAGNLSVCPCISQRGRGEEAWDAAGKQQSGAARLALVPVTCEFVHGTMMIYTNKHEHIHR